jgi:beta-xylosidase
MYYSRCLTLYVASAESPLGPFEDAKVLKYLAIDPMVFQDPGTGDLFLYYADINLPRIWIGEESIFVQPLSDPTSFSENQGPTQLIKPDQHPWEFFRSSLVAPRGINEGAWVMKIHATYYLMYSGAGADTAHYNIGYATASSPLGPFTKHADNPISFPQNPVEAGVFGPGHHSVWLDEVTGRRWAFYHQKRTSDAGWDRFLCVDELAVGEQGELSVLVSRTTAEF